MKKRRLLSSVLCIVLAIAMCLTGCKTDEENTNTPTVTAEPTSTTEPTVTPEAENTATPVAENTATPVPAASGSAYNPEILNGANNGSSTDEAITDTTNKYIKLALNVYYNDSSTNYYDNEAGPSIYVTEAGQYTLTFDCATDLSDDAKAAGVSMLKNLTAVYILDMGVADGEQSPVTACNIRYDAIVVNGTELTLTSTEAKSAIKSTGIFDTNDPINGWDGSVVAEADADSNHAANFTTIENPTVISVVFTLSDICWDAKADEAEEVAGSGYTNTAIFSNLDFSGMDALTLTKYMGNGINLGNTMEASSRSALGLFAAVRNYETNWGQPVTTEAMIKGMKNCGFDTIRIPVAWTNTMNYENGDYTIRTDFMDRVQEIVDYALDNEMFVIINDHWDGGWWARFGAEDQATRDAAMEMYISMWTQIADRFKDYSSMLIFESANEELGDRLNNTGDWAGSGYLDKSELYPLVNKINQTFVDTIRATGGNNAERFLLIAGYDTNFDKTVSDDYKMPTDSTNSVNKLILSVHYYDPWNYAGTDKDARWGLKSEYEYMNEQFAKLTKFTDAGYGVIIGEYGALPYQNDEGITLLKQNTIEYTTNLLDLCDYYNYVPVLWSCNDLYSKKNQTMYDEELTALYTSRCYAEESKLDYATVQANAKAEIDENTTNAIDMWPDVETYEAGTPVAWIMWNGGAGTYSVGDTFNPADNTDGIVATNAVVDGAGLYTVSLDFKGGNDGLTFAALAIADGELLYPNCIIQITSIKIDGTEVALDGVGYTCSDDGKCTRVNLYNAWVSKVPDEIRCLGSKALASPTILDPMLCKGIKNITITFSFITK